MILKEKTQAVLDYVKENGGRVTVAELATALGRTARSITPSVTLLASEKCGFVTKEVVVEGENKTVYVNITEAGKAYVPSAEADAE